MMSELATSVLVSKLLSVGILVQVVVVVVLVYFCMLYLLLSFPADDPSWNIQKRILREFQLYFFHAENIFPSIIPQRTDEGTTGLCVGCSEVNNVDVNFFPYCNSSESEFSTLSARSILRWR